ncbi:hypothetical protein KR215_008670 [Drosophila sulfurigaster]|nr:hypothetical protein KR215_008670 [Drosophila sulfurigaster]
MKANESRVHILQLNAYCLETILKYLEMEDHLSFAETCHYFRDVFNRWTSSFNYIHVVLMADISVHDFKLLSVVYKNVKTLCVDVDDLMHSLNKHYGNERNYYFRQFCKLIIGMQQLQSLKLWQFDCKKRQYAQNIIKMAGSLHQIKQLEIFAYSEQLSLLEELRISFLETIVDMTEIYLDLIRTCTRLRFLRIFDLHICENFAIQVSKVLEECVDRRPLELIIYGVRDSTIMRTSTDLDSSHLIYSRMNARELIKLF